MVLDGFAAPAFAFKIDTTTRMVGLCELTGNWPLTLTGNSNEC